MRLRRFLLLCGLGLGSGACLAASLENAPCNSTDDCIGSYACVFTATQVAMGEAGWCRPDNTCAVGEQNGCLSTGGMCEGTDFEFACDEETDACYCCDTSGAPGGETIALGVRDPAPDGTSAVCVVCTADSCDSGQEACLAGWDRCSLDDEDDQCGCRSEEENIENALCNDDDDCGADFTCERTLEQLSEPSEALPENQAEEMGACRPDGDPQCEVGQQNGCRADPGFDSCIDGQNLFSICNEAGQCFCCADQTEASGFSLEIYQVAADGSQAACTECPTCDTGNICTRESNAACQLNDGVCGCTA